MMYLDQNPLHYKQTKTNAYMTGVLRFAFGMLAVLLLFGGAEAAFKGNAMSIAMNKTSQNLTVSIPAMPRVKTSGDSRVISTWSATLIPASPEMAAATIDTVPSATYFPFVGILLTGLCILSTLLFLKNTKDKKTLRELQAQAAHVQMLRDSIMLADKLESVTEVVTVMLRQIGEFMPCEMLVLSVCDNTCQEEGINRLYWYTAHDEDNRMRSAVEHAIATEFIKSLNAPFWVPDIAGYPTLFDCDNTICNTFGSACFVPFTEPRLKLVLGAMFERDDHMGALKPDPDGHIIRLEHACFAISRALSRVQIENTLRKQRAIYSGMFETLGFARLLADPESGEICDANVAAAQFFEFDIKNLKKMTLWQLHSQGELAAKGLYKRASRSTGYAFEMRHFNKEGKARELEVHAAPVQIDGALRLFITFHDVSQRKHVEAALADSEQRLRRLVENAPIALAMCDQQCNFLFVNPAYAKLFGYTREEMKEMSFKALLRETDISNFMHFQTMFLQEGEGAVKEWITVRHDGELRTMQIRCFILTGLDGLPQIATFVQDITERQRLEDMMIQNEKMASVGGLAAGMAHEINNPLGGILQGCQNIGRRLDPALPANRKVADELHVSIDDVLRYLEGRSILRFFEGIRESAGRAAKITSNMLDFSRRGNSEHSLAKLDELLDKAIALVATDYDLNKRYDFKQVHIVREWQPDMAPVSCVVTEIEQVALNLLKNAAQAMGEASPPIGQPIIIIRTRDERDMAVFEVEDNGPGMPKHVARRIFEPFFTTKKAGDGTGLGLAVSYFIITNNHRGSVVLDTVPARGTRFTISLPRNS